jgi:hypothetical protein
MMKAGDKITFAFGDGEKEGVIERLSAKRAFLRVNFPHHDNKLVVRRISVLEAGVSNNKKKKKKDKEKKKDKAK